MRTISLARILAAAYRLSELDQVCLGDFIVRGVVGEKLDEKISESIALRAIRF
jgi:hypothetical protein